MYDDNDLSGKLVWVTSVCEGCRWSLLIPCSWLYTFPGQPNLYLGKLLSAFFRNTENDQSCSYLAGPVQG